MSALRADMYRLQELVRLHRMGTKSRDVARLLRMSPKTELGYRTALTAAGLLAGDPADLPDLDILKVAVLEQRPPRPAPQQRSSVERWAHAIREMRARGAQPRAIFDRLRLEEPDFAGSLSAIKRFCARLDHEQGVQADDVVIPVETGPGEIAQVDFGYVGKLYDPREGVLRKAWVFVMVLGYSRHLFARVVFDQRVETWLALHQEAFRWFGAVPQVLVPDNLKAAVVRAAFAIDGAASLNRSYRELARHYGFKVDPTPIYAPEKKGKVESAVRYVKRSFFRPRDLADVDVANRELDRWVREIAGLRHHGTTGRKPREVFEQAEAQHLLPLPGVPFETVMWKEATVHTDSHVSFEKRLYSVPWRLIGKTVWIRATPATVTIYADDTRVATHDRRGTEVRSTLDHHLPEHRGELRHRSRSFWEQRADGLGDEVGAFIREVFDADEVLTQLRTVQAMVRHLQQFPVERARAACARARFYGNHTYGGLKRILAHGLDLEPLPTAVVPARGVLESPRYARSAQQLLDLQPPEVPDECH